MLEFTHYITLNRRTVYVSADINQIARACNVSKATVSRVFTQKPGVSDKVREKILDMARKMNYSPKQVIARDTVAVVVAGLDVFYNPGRFQGLLISAVMAQFAKAGYDLKITTIDDIELLVPSYIKAAMVFVGDAIVDEVCARLEKINIPVVLNNMISAGAYSVSDDAAEGARKAVNCLYQNGHRRIALVLDTPTSWASRQRIEGYRQALAENSLPYDDYLVNYNKDNGLVETLACVTRTDATAVYIAGEGIIEEAVYMLNLLKVRVPEDLSVVSCERSPSSRWFTPPHTTISQNLEEIAVKSGELITAIINGENPSKTLVKVSPALIERDSVRSLK